MKYSICIGAYQEKDVYYHLQKVKEHNLDGLEYYKWWNLDLRKVAQFQEKLGVSISAICTRFISLVDEKYRDQYIEGLKETVEACQILGVKSIISQTGNYIPDKPRDIQLKNMVETLKECAPICEKNNVVLEIEPLNAKINHPGYFLQRSEEAKEVIEKVDSPNVRLCFDIYHQQITEGDVTRNAVQLMPLINHYHIADNPGRTEPGTGELNYKNILKAIKANGFKNYVGLECSFTVDTDDALRRIIKEVLP
ncbi:MAG: TIM barrel protein [Kosmotoga sp.]|jgi:hydroxypyruvate isomerase|nr:MAG: TIM barrel protein [Kosmotoga sp.]